jgi:cell division septation protein DedD
MALIKPTAVLMLGFIAVAAMYPQNSPAMLSTKIQNIEKILAAKPGPAEKNAAYKELARLMELSGNMEAAAKAWNDAAAAAAEPDYEALLRSGSCLAAIGEFERALGALKTASAAGGETGLSSRWLSAQIEAFRSGNTGELRSLFSQPAFASYRPAIYYSIWKISGEEEYRTKLLSEFPQSPEALACKAGPVNAAPTALWLLGGLIPQIATAAQPATASTAQAPTAAASVQPAPTAQTQAAVQAQAAAPVTESAGPKTLQAGLFGKEDNAHILAEKLRKAGFVPGISEKTVNGQRYWAVGVPPGQDHNRTILLLKDAGFEAFPVY